MSSDGPNPCEIVGIIKDVKNFGLEGRAVPEMVLPLSATFPRICFRYRVRTRGEPASMASLVRDTVLAIDKDQPVHNIRSMDQLLSNSLAGRRFMMTVLGLFAGVALTLCAIGIYGLISYTVAQRTHEFGIRMALGARVIDLLQLVLGQGVKLALAGLALGVFGAWAGTRLLAGQLYGLILMTRPRSPWEFLR